MKSCAWLICIAVCIQLLSVPVECARKLLNIDYLGIGYDALRGNPQSDSSDPGFKTSVFPLTYTKNTESADGRFLHPDHTTVHQVSSCSFNARSEVVKTISMYTKLLQVGILSAFFISLQVCHGHVLLSYDQLRAASLIGRNAVT